ncbi:hypothetical protein [Goodfellowiella coeruleoviolacea]|uniref:Uncharacterized protein n=1 Tax=Goodfellowiella coeruleoviolacea TaxID=334858 RepID=A0AAE3GJS2_9PSEU|nr:hypothetical protein [Goodfellowiella coeruleoviolacea]MCP2169547.1 hypothetical protein [Goodfellowiella coeruleoviolacea]
MTPISDALARAQDLLKQDMTGYLSEVEYLIADSDHGDEVVAEVARSEVPRLVAAIRGAIINHKRDLYGMCLGCAPTWEQGRWVREPWPCPVVNELQQYVRDPDSIYDRAPHAR